MYCDRDKIKKISESERLSIRLDWIRPIAGGGEEGGKGTLFPSHNKTRGLMCGSTHTCAAGTTKSKAPRKNETHETTSSLDARSELRVKNWCAIASEICQERESGWGIIPLGSLSHRRRRLHVIVSFPKALTSRNSGEAVSSMGMMEGNPAGRPIP